MKVVPEEEEEEEEEEESSATTNHNYAPSAAHQDKDWGDVYVLRNARVFTLTDPINDNEGELLDIWVSAGKIWALTPSVPQQLTQLCCHSSLPATLSEINLAGRVIGPGLVDIHVHIVGGGGEAGFGSRTPEARATDLIEAGVTTFVATLGTDSVTRGMENLVAHTRALASVQALSTNSSSSTATTATTTTTTTTTSLTGRTWLGGYSFPIENTLTGSVRRDVTLIPEIIGVGELAISDHRGSYPSTQELLRLVAEVRVAGMLAGKAGVTYCHLGEDASGLQPLQDVVERNPLLQTSIVPTHMERSSQLIKEGVTWMKSGGRIDFSGWPDRQRSALQRYRTDPETWELVKERLSISSDSYGSINVFDDDGRLIRYSYGLPSTLLRTLMALVYEDGIPMGTALRLFCKNPATVIGLNQAPSCKGSIEVGGDADLLVLQLPPSPLAADYPREEIFDMRWPSTKGVLQYVIAKGVPLMKL